MIVPLNRSPAPVHPGFFFGQILDKFFRAEKTEKFSRIFLFGKIDFNPEKIFSGIWIIPIFGFTFVPGRRAVNVTEVASFQGNSGKSDPKTESFTLWTVPFWDFSVCAPGKIKLF